MSLKEPHIENEKVNESRKLTPCLYSLFTLFYNGVFRKLGFYGYWSLHRGCTSKALNEGNKEMSKWTLDSQTSNWWECSREVLKSEDRVLRHYLAQLLFSYLSSCSLWKRGLCSEDNIASCLFPSLLISTNTSFLQLTLRRLFSGLPS